MNTLRLNFYYLKIVHILLLFKLFSIHKIIGYTLKNKQKGKCICIHES